MKKEMMIGLIVVGILTVIIISYLEKDNIMEAIKKIVTRADFINVFTPTVKKAAKGTGLFPSLFMAQAILESSDAKGNAGKSTLAKTYNNYFGIKADKSWKGKAVNLDTREVLNGKDVVIKDGFRVYDKPEQSFIDRVKFLKDNSRYTKQGVFVASTPEKQAQALQDAGYATDPNYAKILSGIINTYNLKSLDS